MLLFLLTLFVAATGVVALGYAFLTYKNRAFFGRTWFVSAEAPAEEAKESTKPAAKPRSRSTKAKPAKDEA